MNKTEELFAYLKSTKPKYYFVNCFNSKLIILKPLLLNFSFIANLLFLALILYALFQDIETPVFLAFLLAFCFFLYLVYDQLRMYNTILMNLNESSITIHPHMLLRFYLKKRTLSFEDIAHFYYNNPNYWEGDRRFNLYLKDKKGFIIPLLEINNESEIILLKDKLNSLL
jgi:hypothetical protein